MDIVWNSSVLNISTVSNYSGELWPSLTDSPEPLAFSTQQLNSQTVPAFDYMWNTSGILNATNKSRLSRHNSSKLDNIGRKDGSSIENSNMKSDRLSRNNN